MKKRSAQSNYVTKADLTEAFDKFAIMIGKSFADIDKKFETVFKTMVTKAEFEPFKHDTEQSLYELKADMAVVKGSLDSAERRLGSLESKFDAFTMVVSDHESRIFRIEAAR